MASVSSCGGFQKSGAPKLNPQKRIPHIWRVLCGSFLVRARFLNGDYNIPPKKEVHGSLQAAETLIFGVPFMGLGALKPGLEEVWAYLGVRQ